MQIESGDYETYTRAVTNQHLRTLGDFARSLAAQQPAVIVTGPRQSGKTTLCRMTWPEAPYVNLERPDIRAFAQDDPSGFLAQFAQGAILDEIQRVPDLTSWLQVLIDEDPTPGRWILTGSEQLTITGRTSQSLAGRAGFAHLLPFDVEELAAAGLVDTGDHWSDVLLRGGYPAPFVRPVERSLWLDGYVQSYLERDVRNVLAVGDLSRFQTFLGLAAAWTGQTVNLSRLGSDAGVTHPTAGSWLSVLEATFLTYRLRPWHANIGKRLTKSPKLHWWDAGLLCHLLRIRTAQQLLQHPLRGAIFETWVISELLKLVHHRGERPDAFFYGEHQGLEVDLLLRRDDHWLAIEIKSGATVANDAYRPLTRVMDRLGGAIDGLPMRPTLIYGGDDRQRRTDADVVPWRELATLL